MLQRLDDVSYGWDMNALDTLTPDVAAKLYRQIEDGPDRELLDYLSEHPDQIADSEAIQHALFFLEHRQVALSAYAIGEVASSLGIPRPWHEGQRGYSMPADHAALFQQARRELKDHK